MYENRGDHEAALEELRELRVRALTTPPTFPSEWGPPLAQCWITVEFGGKETRHTERPVGTPSLTVWAFHDQFGERFEATATFKMPCTETIFPGEGPETTWRIVSPRGKGWEIAGGGGPQTILWKRLTWIDPFRSRAGEV